MPQPVPYVVIRCPRCKKRSLKITKHQYNRFVCGGSSSVCDAYDGQCWNCDFPLPEGSRAYVEKHKTFNEDGFVEATVSEHGKYVSPEAEHIFLNLQNVCPRLSTV
ncbi:MAG: hypothetical protein ACE5F6_00075 [Anaerolineae bacterium]